MDESAVLRPLVEAAADVRRLDDYDNAHELAAAIVAVVDAVEKALRVRLRNDPGASDDHRLSALSREQLPYDELVKSLRTRDLISLETAGTLHQARDAAERAAAGNARPADADVVKAAVRRVRDDLTAHTDGPVPESAQGGGRGAAPADATAAGVDGSDRTPEEASGGWGPGSRGMRWTAAAFAAAVLVGVAWVALRSGSAEYDDAMAAFRAGRHDSAAVGFEAVLDERPRNVTAMLYLARSYRRLDRPSEAADVLRGALEIDPEDGDLRRELGHLFMDLGRSTAAVAQYERALEYDPENPLNWAALIRALRSLDDPRAEQLLRDAPAEVQAALRGA